MSTILSLFVSSSFYVIRLSLWQKSWRVTWDGPFFGWETMTTQILREPLSFDGAPSSHISLVPWTTFDKTCGFVFSLFLYTKLVFHTSRQPPKNRLHSSSENSDAPTTVTRVYLVLHDLLPTYSCVPCICAMMKC